MWPYIVIPSMAGCTIGLFAHQLRHMYFADTWKESITRFGPEGKPVPIDEQTQALCTEVLDRMALSNEKADAISYFPCREHNPVSIGSINVKTGAKIGLPPSVMFQSLDDIDKLTLTVGKDRKLIDWDSENGLKLEKSLILSEQAKKFMIGREINYVRTSYLYVDLFMQAISLFGGAYLLNLMDIVLEKQKVLKLHVAHSPTRTVAVLVTGVFLFSTYIQMNDLYYYWRDYSTDQKTANIRRDFAEGGVEYYTKILARNQAIRELMGHQGADLYTADGDEVMKWNRHRHVPFTVRRDYLKTLIPQDETSPEVSDDK